MGEAMFGSATTMDSHRHVISYLHLRLSVTKPKWITELMVVTIDRGKSAKRGHAWKP